MALQGLNLLPALDVGQVRDGVITNDRHQAVIAGAGGCKVDGPVILQSTAQQTRLQSATDESLAAGTTLASWRHAPV